MVDERLVLDWGRLLGRASRRNVALMALAMLAACAGDPTDLTEPVESPAVSIRLSVSTLKVEQGQHGFAGVTVTRTGGVSGSVSVAVDSLPPRVTSRPQTIGSGGTQCVIELSVASDAPPGSYPLSIRATVPGAAPATARLTLEIVASWFRLTATPTTVTVRQNDATGTLVVDVEESERFNRTISLTVSGAPPGLEATVAGPWGSESLWALSATVSREVAPGEYRLTVTGSATGMADQSASVDIIVVAEAPPVTAVLPRIVAGSGHTCGMTGDGTPYCWGNNSSGKLGDGTKVNRLAPVAVSGGLKLKRLALGSHHTCGLSTDGHAYCWGSNNAGQLGDSATYGPTSTVLSPRPVSGGHVFTEIAAGWSHTCALTPQGKAYCWGENFTGALGDGTTVDRAVPVPVSGGMTFTSIVAVGAKTCALTRWQAAYCWGQNYPGGQLGDGTGVDRSTPTAVAGHHVFASLSANASCGLTPTGTALCWGGNPAFAEGTVPTLVPGDLSFVQFTGSCGLTTNGSAVCWGSAPIGDGTSLSRSVFVAVSGGLTFTSIAGGRCGITIDGTAYCWGRNIHGEIGDGTAVSRLAPVLVAPGLRFRT